MTTMPPAFATAARRPPNFGSAETVHCDIAVEFGSLYNGIDTGVLNEIWDYVAANSSIMVGQNYPWGREGETTLCLRMKPGATGKTVQKVYADIKSMLPPNPARGCITLYMGSAGAESFSVP